MSNREYEIRVFLSKIGITWKNLRAIGSRISRIADAVASGPTFLHVTEAKKDDLKGCVNASLWGVSYVAALLVLLVLSYPQVRSNISAIIPLTPICLFLALLLAWFFRVLLWIPFVTIRWFGHFIPDDRQEKKPDDSQELAEERLSNDETSDNAADEVQLESLYRNNERG